VITPKPATTHQRQTGSGKLQAGATPGYRQDNRGNVLTLALTGQWVTNTAVSIDRSLQDLALDDSTELEIDGRELSRFDSAGAWLVLRTQRQAEGQGKHVRLQEMPEGFQPLIEVLKGIPAESPPGDPHTIGLKDFIVRVGRSTCALGSQAYAMLCYLGIVTVEAGETALHKRRFRPFSLMAQIVETGLTALPILGLLSFLLGTVIAYQGVDQLKRFGAEIFTVDLVGVSILREIAVLITAIIVAGRSGSAFTAQIGAMKVNDEIDAMETMGVNVVEVLVLPRILGLIITLPLLTIFADAMGLLGGAMMCYFDLGIRLPAFFHQLHAAISLTTFFAGLVKAPVFAFLIALVGCFEGLRVESNAASVGRQTTRSVVESIFLVIVCDAIFSIVFSLMGI